MATPSYIPLDWSPDFSIEDCNSAYNYGETPSVADGQVSQCLDAPTPALYIDNQGQQRWSRSTSRTPLEPPQQSFDFVRYEDWDPDATGRRQTDNKFGLTRTAKLCASNVPVLLQPCSARFVLYSTFLSISTLHLHQHCYATVPSCTCCLWCTI